MSVEEDETRFLEIPLKFKDKRGEKMGQEGFYRVPDLRKIKNLCIGQRKRAVKDVPVRVGQDFEPRLPTLHDTGVGRLRFKKL